MITTATLLLMLAKKLTRLVQKKKKPKRLKINHIASKQEGAGFHKSCPAEQESVHVLTLDQLNADVLSVILKFLYTQDRYSFSRVCCREGLYCILLFKDSFNHRIRICLVYLSYVFSSDHIERFTKGVRIG